MNSISDKIIYVVNARLPNERAHSYQILQTVEALNKKVEIVLVSPLWAHKHNTQKARHNFKHLILPAIDLPLGNIVRFYVRSVTFILALYMYLLMEYLRSVFQGKKVVIYTRGEIVFFILPFLRLFPIYFETHQIRNYESLYRWLLRNITGIVVVTERLKSKFVNDYKLDPGKIVVARDAVDLDLFDVHRVNNAESKSIVQLPDKKKVIMYTGSLGAEKGVHTLALAASMLPEDYHVVFVGGLDAQVVDFRSKYGNNQRITIIGRVDHSLVSTYLQKADVLVLPDLASDTYSNLYTSPMKLFEYMASGVCILASHIPSLREVLNDNSAFFFTSGDASDLAKNIKAAITDEVGRQQRAVVAHEEVRKYTWEARADIILRLIETVR